MKLYQIATAANPRRVIVYLAEKGIDIERVEIDADAKEQKSAAFLAINPAGKVPVLLLDDGRAIPESAAIMEYLEEIHPDPPMIGTEPVSRARVRFLERIGHDLATHAQLWLMHSAPYFADRFTQEPLVAEASKAQVDQLMAVLEQHIGDAPFLAGDQPTIADCTAFALLQAVRTRLRVNLGHDCPRLDAWYTRFAGRPSAAF